jgi:hypothetical protein
VIVSMDTHPLAATLARAKRSKKVILPHCTSLADRNWGQPLETSHNLFLLKQSRLSTTESVFKP